MGITKFSAAIFMIILLISAPFFTVQTRQEGINRVLAEDFTAFIPTEQLTEIPVNVRNDTTLSTDDFVNATLNSFTNAKTYSFEVLSGMSYLVQNGIGNVTSGNQLGYFVTINPNTCTLNCNFGNIYAERIQLLNIEENGSYIIESNVNGYFVANYTRDGLAISVKAFKTDIVNVFQDYYQIMENARTANYSNVESFTNVFYTIPKLASDIADTYNRFINFTDRVNPFKTVDEETGQIRDKTFSEIGDSWYLRLWLWIRGD